MADFKRTSTIQASEVTPEKLADSIKNLFDEPAQREIEKAMGAIITWARMRFAQLGVELNSGYTIDLGLNAYNETYGWGIQSVAVGFRKDGQELRLPGHIKDSTIGVVTPDLIENGMTGIIGVPLDNGQSEIITGMTPGLRFDGTAKENLYDTVPATLNPAVTVDGPDCARTIVRIAANKITDEVLIGVDNRGVYVCEYVNQDIRDGRPLC